LEALLGNHQIAYLHAASAETEAWSLVIEFETTDGHYDGVLRFEGDLVGFSWEWFHVPPEQILKAFSALPYDALYDLHCLTRTQATIHVKDSLTADGAP